MSIKNMFSRKKIVIIVIAVVVIGFLIVLNQKYSKNSAQYQPLSIRGLPPPATDVPVTLPPDPGEAGKATLAGIDSDHDGVRDDIEREIVYMYPQNEQVRRVLRAMVKTEQQIITTTGDHEYFKGLEIESLAFLNCYFDLIFGASEANLTNINILESMLTNTPERKKKEEDNYKESLPFAGPGIQSGLNCMNPLVKGKY